MRFPSRPEGGFRTRSQDSGAFENLGDSSIPLTLCRWRVAPGPHTHSACLAHAHIARSWQRCLQPRPVVLGPRRVGRGVLAMSTPRSHMSEPSPHPSATPASSLCLGRNVPGCLERDHCPGPNLLCDIGGHPSLPLWASEHPGKDSVPDPEITRKPGALPGGLIPGARQWRLRPEVGQRKIAPSQLQLQRRGPGRRGENGGLCTQPRISCRCRRLAFGVLYRR